MVKISQNETHLRLSLKPEEKMKLGSLIDALTEDGRGNILDNTVEVTKKGHIWKESEIINAVSQLCKEQKIELDYDVECQKIVDLHQSTKQQAEAFSQSAQQFHARKNQENYDVELPTTFKRTLKEYQKPSVDHLYSVGNGANFSVPGSGKTTIALAAYSLMKEAKQVDCILVICPRSAYMSWEDEFEQCFERPPNTVRLSGENVDKKHSNVDIFLSTYQFLSYRPEDFTQLLQKHKILMILDESHYIKNGKKVNPTSWQKVARDIAPYAKRKMILSGTPCPNSLDDLWTQIDFLYPNQQLLGTFDLFSAYTKAHEQLGTYNEKIKNLYTRISKEDLDLPQPHFEVIDVKMDDLQTKIYNGVEARVIDELLEESKSERAKMSGFRGERGGKIVRLLQAASNPVLLTRNDKEFDLSNTEQLIDADTSELIENYASLGKIPTKLLEACKKARDLANSGEKVIIWTSFLHNIAMIEQQLLRHNVNQNQVLKIDGSVPKDDDDDANYNREKIIRAFKENPNYKILIATPPSCSESVSLHINKFGETVCKNAIYFDRTFNAAHYMQSKDRIHRIGMKNDTEVTYWIFRATCEREESDETVLCHIEDWTHNRLNRKETRMLGALGDDITTFDLNTTHKALSVEEIRSDTADFLADLRKKGVIK